MAQVILCRQRVDSHGALLPALYISAALEKAGKRWQGCIRNLLFETVMQCQGDESASCHGLGLGLIFLQHIVVGLPVIFP